MAFLHFWHIFAKAASHVRTRNENDERERGRKFVDNSIQQGTSIDVGLQR